MGIAKSVQLGKEFFPKKEDLKTRIHSLVESYRLMSYVEGADKELCLHLFKLHPNYLLKIGVGIESIQIRPGEYGTRKFHLHRIDGSDEEISWVKCMKSI